MEKRDLEVFFCPDNLAIIRPAPTDRPPRDMQQSVTLAKANPWPDHVVFLMAKGKKITDWACVNLPAVAARRVSEFVRTRNPRILSTLTEREMEQLREQNELLDTRLKI